MPPKKCTEDSEAMRSLRRRRKHQVRGVGTKSSMGLHPKHYCPEPKAILLHSPTTSASLTKH